MNFKKFNTQIQAQFAIMCKTGKLFTAKVSGRDLWDLYLAAFENEQVFRDPESSEHNCNSCNNFIRRYGNITAIVNGEVQSLFSNIGDVGEYTDPAKILDAAVKSSGIKDVFFESYFNLNEKLNYESCKKNQKVYKLGLASNLKQYTQEEVDEYGVVNTDKIYEFNHFSVNLPKAFVHIGTKSLESLVGNYRDKYSVFERGMRELPLDTLILVKDLVNQGSLLDGTSHLHAVNEFITLKKAYDKSSLSKELYCWIASYEMDIRVAKFKNTLIGVLCTELAEGEELNKACLNWNKRVDPANYHKVTAPITKRQIAEARKFVEENGYEASFSRKIATLEDIRVSEIKHMNVGSGKIKEVSVFDNVKSTPTRHKKSQFDKLEEVSIEKFMKDILPSCTSVEAYLENKMEGNLAVLTTSNISNSKPIFKWANNYSWTFNGNLTGKSQIKEAVKMAGGNVTGVLNFRLAWNDGDGKDDSDLDAWAREPISVKIGFSTAYRKDGSLTRNRSPRSGQLDVDNTSPRGKLAVENITWTDKTKMQDGKYDLWVNQYSARHSQGFKAEIEFDGETYSYEYNQPLGSRANVQVATITVKSGEFSIKHHLPETNSSKELWGLETKNFHKVNLICLSPNHWGDNAVGNLHYFFMLDKCKTDSDIRGFHNENLNADLLTHKKVMEVLGNTSMIQANGSMPLAGLGFNSTVKDELIVKITGSHKRMLRIKI